MTNARHRPMCRAVVELGRTRIVCEVARTAAEQARGLQGHGPLGDSEGMLFPFHAARATTVHRGRVAFPIDLIFVDGSGRAARIIHAAQPGTRTTWTHPITTAVVETRGGLCADLGFNVGDEVRALGRPVTAAQTYNLLRTLTEAELGEPRGPDDGEESPFDVHADDPPPLIDGYYGKEPKRAPPDFGGEHDDMTPPAADDPSWPSGTGRWNDRTLPDQDPNAMHQPNPHWDRAMPYVRDLGDPEPPGGTRMGQRVEVKLEEMVPRVLVGALRVGIPWEPLVLNDKRERAVITPTVIGQWLHALGLSEEARSVVHQASVTTQALDALATAMISEKMADTANISTVGDQHILVVTRRKQETPWT